MVKATFNDPEASLDYSSQSEMFIVRDSAAMNWNTPTGCLRVNVASPSLSRPFGKLTISYPVPVFLGSDAQSKMRLRVPASWSLLEQPEAFATSKR
jgi:hypothetical protein